MLSEIYWRKTNTVLSHSHESQNSFGCEEWVKVDKVSYRDTVRIDGTRNTGLNKYITNLQRNKTAVFKYKKLGGSGVEGVV